MRCAATRARVGVGRVKDVREIGNPREMLPGPDKLAFGVPVGDGGRRVEGKEKEK